MRYKFDINIDNNLEKDYEIITKKEYENILKQFKKYGILNFSRITSNVNNITKFTNLFSDKYSHDAQRRKVRFNNINIRNVDSGFDKILLHSETSFSPARPEIIWFYCVNPPKTDSGETIICDGISLWDSLLEDTKKFFLKESINYKLRIPVDNKIKGKGKKPWRLDHPGVKNCFLNLDDKLIEFDYTKFAVEKDFYNDKFTFANHLLVPLTSEPQIISRKMSNGKEIPEKIVKEIHEKANSLTKKIKWVKNDLLMLDNIRYMHGREAINENENERDIVTIQTSKSNFYYKYN